MITDPAIARIGQGVELQLIKGGRDRLAHQLTST
jgi:hypothetical protein